MWPSCCAVTHSCLIEQTRINKSHPGRRSGTAVGDELHVLQALLSRKDILTLRDGPWVCAVSALVIMILFLSQYILLVFLTVFRNFSGVNHIFVNPELGLSHLLWSSYFLESIFKVKSTSCGHHLKLRFS